MSGQSTRYLGTREAAAFLGLSPRTLDRYRVTGEGPAFHRFRERECRAHKVVGNAVVVIECLPAL